MQIVAEFDRMKIWQNLEKKCNTDYDFPPPLHMGGK